MALTRQGEVYSWGGTLKGKRGQGKEVRGAAEKYVPMKLTWFGENKLKVKEIACG